MPHRLKVLQMVSGRDLNGALTYCRSLTERLISAGHEVHVVCRDDCWLRNQLPGVPFLESRLNRSWKELRRVRDYVRTEGFDLVHTHMSRAHLFGVLMRMGTRIPVIATAHSCNFQPHWCGNDFVIANSRSTLRYHRRTNWISRHRSAHVYCFTDLERFRVRHDKTLTETRTRLGVSPQDFAIGLVGQVCDRKGQRTMFEALPAVLAEVPHAKLVVLGPRYDESPYVRHLRALVRMHQLEQRVIWASATDNVVPYMQMFDLCVVPSNKEPLGLVAVEALAAGTAVIASNEGGLPEIVQHEKTGLLVPKADRHELAQAVIRAAKSPDWISQLAVQGREHVGQLFDPRKLTAEVESIYYQVSGRCRQLAAA